MRNVAMKRFLVGSVCVLGASGSAFAQSPFFYGDSVADAPTSHLDHRRQIRDEVESPREFTSSRALWNSVYFGANAGLAGGEFRYPVSVTSSTDAASAAIGLKASGFAGGGMVGFNALLGNKFVGGFEADMQASSLTGQVAVDVAQDSVKAGSRLDLFGTARGRLGALVIGDQGLLYATGGFAYAGVTNFISASVGGVSDSISKETLALGWTVGGGFEYALNDRWSLRTEYLYVDLGKKSLLENTVSTYTATLGVETKANIVRAGVAYRFGTGEPIIAKY
jgi:outer membrane immunogenic protein